MNIQTHILTNKKGNMKIAIIYYSQSGNTKILADKIIEGVQQVEGIEVKAMTVDNFDKQFIAKAKAILFGSPTYAGTYSWQIKKWFDTCPVNLGGKLGSVFATGAVVGGGAEIAEHGMAGMMLVRGMLVYTAGHAEGMPFTHMGAVAINNSEEWQLDRAKVLGQRVAEKALELFKD